VTDDSDIELVDGPNAIYADSVTVIYHSVESPSDRTPQATIVMMTDGRARNVDREQLRLAAQQLVWVPTDKGGLTNESFITEERYQYANWGSSGAFLELVLWASTAAGSGIIGGAVWDGLKKLLTGLRPAGESPQTAAALTESSARRRAVNMAFVNFPDLDKTKDLTVLSCTLTGQQATVMLRPPDGSTIVVTLSAEDDGTLASITRAYPD
jgi:hypothetical protein